MDIPSKSNGEHYNLRWNSYTNNLMQVLLDHQHNENLVDVTLCCEGQFIKAHKLILSACSEVFQEMFQLHDVQHPIIILNGIKFNHIKHILDFIYQGEVKVLDTDLEGVLALGESLQVKGLSSIKLKQKVSSEELKTNVLKHSSNNTEAKSNSLRNSPTLNNPSFLNSVNQQNPKNVQQSQTKSENKSNTKKIQTDKNVSLGPKKVQANSINLNNDSNKNMSKLESILTDTNETAQRKRFRTNETHSSNLKNGSSSREDKTSESSVETEKNSRPANAFMIFANEWRKKLAVEHPDENNKAISVKLGNMWKSLSNETKQSYYFAARKMELEQKTKCSDSSQPDTFKKKLSRRRTIDSISHLVSVDLQEYDDNEDDLQIIEVNEDPIDVSNFPKKRNKTTNDT